MDVLIGLRRLDFPESARVALDQLAASVTSSSIPGLGTPSDDLADQIVAEFIFSQHANKARSRKFSAIQELQVVDILLKYFSVETNETTRHLVFKAVFSKVSDDERRLTLLCKLISTAVAVHGANILNSAAVWMQTHGCNSEVASVVLATLVQDYCTLIPCSVPALRDLPKVSLHFACNILTAATYLYALPGSKTNKPILTKQLLELITDWLTSSPHIGLVSLCQSHSPYLQSQRPTLWTSPTKPNTQTPIPGLVRWATKAPLVDREGVASCVPEEESNKHKELWSRLHLAVLQTVLAFPTVPGAPQLELITLADMLQNVKDITALTQQARTSDALCQDDAALAVDRLVQTLQVALATGAFRCSLSDLRGICQLIPSCRLLTIVQNEHLSFTPPPMHNAT